MFGDQAGGGLNLIWKGKQISMIGKDGMILLPSQTGEQGDHGLFGGKIEAWGPVRSRSRSVQPPPPTRVYITRRLATNRDQIGATPFPDQVRDQ